MSKKKEIKINMGFWAKLPKPFFALAPMLDVTDMAFRQMFVKYSKKAKKSLGPHVMFTEFVSADGICSKGGKKNILPMLDFKNNEKPIVAQIFSSKPENMLKTARLCRKLGFDGIDINMGCPERNILKQGAGAALIQEPKLAQEIIYATKKGAGNLPVSVKTRLGFSKNEIETWIPALLETDLAAITLHARTRKEMSKTSADWDSVKRMMEIIKESGKSTLGIGNGDIWSIEDAQEKIKKYKCDGVMIARGSFGKPWFFAAGQEKTPEEKVQALKEHTKLFDKLCKHKNFSSMKKHFKAYLSDFDRAKELRKRLMKVKNYEEFKQKSD